MAKKQFKDKTTRQVTLEMAWEEIQRLQAQHNATQRRIDLQVTQCSELIQQVMHLEERVYSLEHPERGQLAEVEEIDPEVFAVRPWYMTEQHLQADAELSEPGADENSTREEIVVAITGEHVAWVDTSIPTGPLVVESPGPRYKQPDPELEALLDQEKRIAQDQSAWRQEYEQGFSTDTSPGEDRVTIPANRRELKWGEPWDRLGDI